MYKNIINLKHLSTDRYILHVLQFDTMKFQKHNYFHNQYPSNKSDFVSINLLILSFTWQKSQTIHERQLSRTKKISALVKNHVKIQKFV